MVLENLDYFEGEWSRTRYPKEKEGRVVSPIDIYKAENAEKAVEKAEEVYNLIAEILSKMFKLKI